MKKFYFLFNFILICISCSTDSSSIAVNPNLLQRVDYYPGTVSEKRWIFNGDGLLKEITKADGTVVQSFTYNSHNLLTSSTVFNSGLTENHTFTYDNNDFVNTVDGQTLNYDTTIGAYYLGDLNQAYQTFKINSDKLIANYESIYIDSDDNGNPIPTLSSGYQVVYLNNNVISSYPYDSCSAITHDGNTNPLRNATLSICRAFSFVPYFYWANSQYNSANNVLSSRYCTEDPESDVYHYTYNANNLPQQQTNDSYYFSTLETTSVSAKYYYQGDVLP